MARFFHVFHDISDADGEVFAIRCRGCCELHELTDPVEALEFLRGHQCNLVACAGCDTTLGRDAAHSTHDPDTLAESFYCHDCCPQCHPRVVPA